MVNLCPNVADDSRFPIGEAAALLGVSRGALRRYTDEGVIKCGRYRANKRRFYKGSELKRFWRSEY